MTLRWVIAATLSLGCAALGHPAPSTIPISVRSHNRSHVDVYLLCGEQEAEWLGELDEEDSKMFEVPASRARCVTGLNFFLVPRPQKRGYWVGPIHPPPGSGINLTIEKYAGLSSAGTYLD
jgi:hypothetical protein